VIEKTAYVYRKAQENRLVLGRSISAVLVAAIYIACREMGIPRTLNDITTRSNVRRKSVAKCYRFSITTTSGLHLLLRNDCNEVVLAILSRVE